MSTLTSGSYHNILFEKEMENSLFTPCLDRLFNLWNKAVHQMNYWVCTAGRYRATSFLGKVEAALFNCCQFDEMTDMPDEIILARMITTLDLEFEKTIDTHETKVCVNAYL